MVADTRRTVAASWVSAKREPKEIGEKEKKKRERKKKRRRRKRKGRLRFFFVILNSNFKIEL